MYDVLKTKVEKRNSIEVDNLQQAKTIISKLTNNISLLEQERDLYKTAAQLLLSDRMSREN